MYIKITDGDQSSYSIGQLRRDNPNVSFPRSIPEATLASYGVYPTTVGSSPSYDPLLQDLVTATTATQVGGVWTYVTTAQYKTGVALEESVRLKRTGLLMATDHYGMSDMTMTDAIATYRQTLRDVPQQAGFPNDITWPTEPEG
tara:strand:+ start:1076 stop:1507 length:432 start_codon:yes stop_codon:yes gene_type:complete